MSTKLHVLQHSLGLDRHGQGPAYRNHFVTSPGTIDWPVCLELVGEGLMARRQANALTGGSACFAVTDAGRAFVAEHSPKPPKLSRSQKRYRQWLSADCGLKFGEWLKVQPHAA